MTDKPSPESTAERDILWELKKLDSACNMTPRCQSPYAAHDCYKKRHPETSPPSDSDLRCDCPCHNALLIDNLPFYPAIQDPDPCDIEKVKIALSLLKRSQPQAWEDIDEALSAGNKKRARKLIERYHPRLHRSMRPVMWKKLFKLATPKTDLPRRRRDKTPDPIRERFRRILRKHAPKSFRDISDETTWPKVVADFVANKLDVPTSLRPRPEWRNVKTGTPLFSQVIENLRRYYYRY